MVPRPGTVWEAIAPAVARCATPGAEGGFFEVAEGLLHSPGQCHIVQRQSARLQKIRVAL
jgi:hypothetical protein